MSIHLSSKVWRTELGGGTVKAVAMKLADCADDDGTNVWPSVRRIARETEASERAVQYALRTLATDLKLLVVVEEGGKGPKSTTEYRFDMAVLEALHAKTLAKWSAEDEAEGQKKRRKGAKSAPIAKGAMVASKGAKSADKGATIAPDPSYTHQLTVSATPLSPSQAKGKPRTAKTGLSRDWVIPSGWFDWAIANAQGIPDADGAAALEADKFRDYWVGHGKRMADWEATWRNWWRKAVGDRRTRAPARNGHMTNFDRKIEGARRFTALMDAREAAKKRIAP